MTILRWDVPKKVRTAQEWAEHAGFDGGPTGGYVPNMSEADQLSWKAKITGKKLGYPQVEIRKTTSKGSQVVIIVNLGDGYNYKYYRAEDPDMASYATVDEYLDSEALKYFKKYPANYKTLEEARNLVSQYVDEDRFALMKNPTRGINVHIATNGPIQMTFQEMQDMQSAVEEAKQVLTELEGVNQ